MSTAFQSNAFQSDAWQIAAGTGEAPVTVPDVVGQTQAEGTGNLEADGFVVVVKTEQSNQPAGTIISQEPVGGSLALPGSTVTITVSLGSTGAGSNKRRIRERYIARFKGEDHEFGTLEELEEFVQKAQEKERQRPKQYRKPIKIRLTPAFVEEATDVVETPRVIKAIPTLPPSLALQQIRQIEARLKRTEEDDDDDEVLLWLI